MTKDERNNDEQITEGTPQRITDPGQGNGAHVAALTSPEPAGEAVVEAPAEMPSALNTRVIASIHTAAKTVKDFPEIVTTAQKVIGAIDVTFKARLLLDHRSALYNEGLVISKVDEMLGSRIYIYRLSFAEFTPPAEAQLAKLRIEVDRMHMEARSARLRPTPNNEKDDEIARLKRELEALRSQPAPVAAAVQASVPVEIKTLVHALSQEYLSENDNELAGYLMEGWEIENITVNTVFDAREMQHTHYRIVTLRREKVAEVRKPHTTTAAIEFPSVRRFFPTDTGTNTEEERQPVRIGAMIREMGVTAAKEELDRQTLAALGPAYAAYQRVVERNKAS